MGFTTGSGVEMVAVREARERGIWERNFWEGIVVGLIRACVSKEGKGTEVGERGVGRRSISPPRRGCEGLAGTGELRTDRWPSTPGIPSCEADI